MRDFKSEAALLARLQAGDERAVAFFRELLGK